MGSPAEGWWFSTTKGFLVSVRTETIGFSLDWKDVFSSTSRRAFSCAACFLLQMFEAEEDGAVTENELAVILKSALGVAHLNVSHLFTAIDADDTGKVTFGGVFKSHFLKSKYGFVIQTPGFNVVVVFCSPLWSL